MSSYPNYILWGAAILAFIIGYAIVSFLMKVFKGNDGSSKDSHGDLPPDTIPPDESPRKTMEKFSSITRNRKEQQ